MKRTARGALGALLLAILAGTATSAAPQQAGEINWPAFRGIGSSGIAEGFETPTVAPADATATFCNAVAVGGGRTRTWNETLSSGWTSAAGTVTTMTPAGWSW